MSMARRFLCGLAACVVSGAAWGHVFWLQPSAFSPAAGSVVKVELRVGDTFPGEVVPRNDSKIESFVVATPGGDVKPAPGRDADSAAALIRPATAGVYTLAYRSHPTSITLEAEKFERYLKEEGLEKISELRKKAGKSDAPGIERYSRAAKACIRVGKDGDSQSAIQEFGLRCEIVAMTDPTALTSGGTLEVTVKFDGKPLENALVQARAREDSQVVVRARTDTSGRASLKLEKAGLWVLNTVEMVEAPKDSGAEWESVWASLAFEVRNAEAVAPGGPGAPVRTAEPTRSPGAPATPEASR